MKRGSTIFLKIAVILIGIPVLALCIFLVASASEMMQQNSNPDFAYVNISHFNRLCMFQRYHFYVALYQAFKLLSYIDKNKAFSELSVKALKNIKYCAITISGLYVVGMPFFFIYCGVRRRPRCHINRNGLYFCFNGNRSLCCCSPKTFTRSH